MWKPVRAAGTLLFLLGLACALAGCHGGGHVYVTALNFKAIDPPAGPPPTFTRLTFDRCFWWTDEDGDVWVAMERTRRYPGTDWAFHFRLSLALGEPPAGRARDYLVTQRELRATARFGPAQSRFVSLSGIVALYREPGDRVRGSYRLQVAREVQRPLGDWSRPSRYLMMGTFEAVHDEERGQQIAVETESPGRERPPTNTAGHPLRL